MNVRTGIRLAVILLGSAVALLAVSPGPVAAQLASRSEASVSVGGLVLDPTDRGYQGSLPITVTNKGSAPSYFGISIQEAFGGSVTRLDPESPCTFGGTGYRRTYRCMVPGDALAPGEQRSFSMSFHALVTPRPYAMIVRTNEVTVTTIDGTNETLDRTSYPTLFRSSSGSLHSPRPYVQDSQADAGMTTAGQVTLVRQADGSFAGRLPVTARYGGDAAHEHLAVKTVGLPTGVQQWGTDPQDMPSGLNSFQVPGAQFMPGEQRSFDALFFAPAETPVGALGTATFQLSTYWSGSVVTDLDPADNTVTFSVTTVEAS